MTCSREYLAEATTGQLSTDTRTYFSIEQPWRNNLQGHSCVPEGLYELVWYVSPRHGGTYCLRNPGLRIMGSDALTPQQLSDGYRSFCEIHSANWAGQLEGCIAVGLDGQPMLNPASGKVEPAIERSREAVAALLHELGEDMNGHTLSIVSKTGVPT